MANIEELDRVIAYIEAHPDEHDQRDWFYRDEDGAGGWCHTTMCLAGTTAVLHGWHPFWASASFSSTGGVVKDGVSISAREVAEHVLGLTGVESNELFFEAETLKDIRAIRDVLADGRPVHDWRAEATA